MLGNVVGGTIGGLLGQVGDVFSMPRRAMWSMIGLPGTGAEVVSSATGLDQGGALARALGAGVEVLGDPLTLVFGALGPRAFRAATAPWREDARLRSLVQGAEEAREAALPTLNARNLNEADILRYQLGRAADVERLPLQSIARGEMTRFPLIADTAEAELRRLGLIDSMGASIPAARGQSMAPGVVYGDYLTPAARAAANLPPGTQVLQNNPAFKGTAYDFGDLPLGMQKAQLAGGRMAGSKLGFDPNTGRAMPQVTPEEIQWLRGGNVDPALAPNDISNALLRAMAQRQISSLPPLPTLQEIYPQAGSLFPEQAALSIRDALPQIGKMQGQALATLARNRMTDADWDAVAAVLGGSVGAGGVLGQLTSR